jgi:hypothetical protein
MESEFKVSLMITDESCSPEEITRLTGITPTTTWHKGEATQGTILLRKTNGWVLQSALPRESPLADHVNSLLTAVEPFRTQLRELTEKYFSLLACAVYFDQHAPEVHLDARTIAKLGTLNLGLDIDLYCSK